MTDLQKWNIRRPENLFKNEEFETLLAPLLSNHELLPKQIVGSDWDACLHHGVTTLHKSCLDMKIF